MRMPTKGLDFVASGSPGPSHSVAVQEFWQHQQGHPAFTPPVLPRDRCQRLPCASPPPSHKLIWNAPMHIQDPEFAESQRAKYARASDTLGVSISREALLATPRTRIGFVVKPTFVEAAKAAAARAEEMEAQTVRARISSHRSMRAFTHSRLLRQRAGREALEDSLRLADRLHIPRTGATLRRDALAVAAARTAALGGPMSWSSTGSEVPAPHELTPSPSCPTGGFGAGGVGGFSPEAGSPMHVTCEAGAPRAFEASIP